jgi:hypothetical protein
LLTSANKLSTYAGYSYDNFTAQMDTSPADGEDMDDNSSCSDIENANDLNVMPHHDLPNFEGSELNPFNIEDVSPDMDGYYDGDEEAAVGSQDIDLDNEANPDSDIDDIIDNLSDTDI